MSQNSWTFILLLGVAFAVIYLVANQFENTKGYGYVFLMLYLTISILWSGYSINEDRKKPPLVDLDGNPVEKIGELEDGIKGIFNELNRFNKWR